MGGGLDGALERAAERAALSRETAAWGYATRGVATEPLVIRDRRVLEIGMGAGPFAVAAIDAGASAYFGVDPHVGTDHVRNLRSLADRRLADYAPFPFSRADIQRLYPEVRLERGILEDMVDEAAGFAAEIAVLWGVTEHLRDPASVISTAWRVLRPGGLIWITHNNWYSWIGHHADPRSLKDWEPDNPRHAAVVDWRHLEPAHALNQDPNMNRMRLTDFRDLIDKYFEILEFSYELHALPRLTPAIRLRNKHIPLADLLANCVRVCGRRRDPPLATDLAERQFYHPSADYHADDDLSGEDIAPFGFVGYVHFGSRGQLVSHSDNDFGGRRAFGRMAPGEPITLRKADVALPFTVDSLQRGLHGDVRVILRERVGEELRTRHRAMWVLESTAG